ncbi:MAG: biotin/lipoyl-containing protein [Erysipelotrichaceae bacterium]
MRRKKIKRIIKIFEQSDLTKMEIEFKHVKILLEKTTHLCASEDSLHEEKSPAISEDLTNKGTWVLSPLVGTYYDAPNRTSKPFVSVGDEVKENDVLCVIEAMKIMNELRSKISGRVVEIAITNQSMVQYNQPLIRILEHD